MSYKGYNHLQSVRWQNSKTGNIEEHNINHVFLMTGAVPNTSWLDGCIVLDNKGFIKTGPDLSAENLNTVAGPFLVSHTCLKLVCQVFLL